MEAGWTAAGEYNTFEQSIKKSTANKKKKDASHCLTLRSTFFFFHCLKNSLDKEPALPFMNKAYFFIT